MNDETDNLERHVYSVKEGSDNNNGDSENECCALIALESASFLDELRRTQSSDPEIWNAISQVQERGNVLNGRFKKFRGIRLNNRILFRSRRIVTPASMVDQVIRIVHNDSHWGIQRTFEEVRRRFYWAGLFKDVEKFCSACEVCGKSKRGCNRKQPLVPIKLQYNFPRAVVSFDTATLPWSAGGYRYVLVLTDLFSKFIEAVPMRNQEASSVVSALEQGWFLRHGYPLTLLSDQGRNVDGMLVNALCKSLGIAKLRSSPYHPQGDGQAERSVETFKQAMCCLLEERHVDVTDWPALIQEVTFVCNSYVNAGTGYSPHETMYGATLRSRADTVFPFVKQNVFTDIKDYCSQAEKAREELIEMVRENINGEKLQSRI